MAGERQMTDTQLALGHEYVSKKMLVEAIIASIKEQPGANQLKLYQAELKKVDDRIASLAPGAAGS